MAGNAAVGAAGVNNDRDGVSGGHGPSGFDEEYALVFAAEAAAMLIADDTAGGDGNVAVVGTRSLKNTVPRGGRKGQVELGRRQWVAAAATVIMLTWRGQFLTTKAATG